MRKLIRRLRSWSNSRKFTKKGKYCRFPGRDLVVRGHVEVGDGCRFRDHLVIRTHGKGKIIFGDRSGTSFYCIIEAEELVQVGSGVALAEFCVVRDTNHLVVGTDEHWLYTPHITKPIIIEDGVLVGSGVYIHPGVTIGNGAGLALGRVLLDDTKVGPLEIWAGAPARRVAHRTEGVPPERLAQAQALMEQQGMRKSRFKFDALS